VKVRKGYFRTGVRRETGGPQSHVDAEVREDDELSLMPGG